MKRAPNAKSQAERIARRKLTRQRYRMKNLAKMAAQQRAWHKANCGAKARHMRTYRLKAASL